VLITLLSIVTIAVGLRLWRNSSYVSDPQPDVPARFDQLADKVDPNTADWQTLAALPQLGEKRAKSIVAYREEFVASHPGKRAFEKPDDLTKIRGIGQVMLETLMPYLMFPTTQPATSTQPRL
jgi:DNA uptake protein ComE-like DNA-binding protein